MVGLILTPDQKIQYITFGEDLTDNLIPFNYTKYFALPDANLVSPFSFPIDDAPWLSHIELEKTAWVQDDLEFFYLDNHGETSLGALHFRNDFSPVYYLPEAERALYAVLEFGVETDNYDINDNDIPDNIEQEDLLTQHNASSLAGEAEDQFFGLLGIDSSSIHKLSRSGEAMGGDFEAFPHDVIFHSIHEIDEIKDWLSETRYAGRIKALSTDWLQVSHVDEVTAVIPSDDACGFAILVPDPLLAVEILREQNSTQALEQMIPSHYRNMPSSFPTEDILRSISQPTDEQLELIYGEYNALFAYTPYTNGMFKSFYDLVVFGESVNQEEATRFHEIQYVAYQKIDKIKEEIKEHYKVLHPSCENVKMVSLPVLFSCSLDGGDISYCGAALPNSVNSVVLGDNILVPDPFLPSLRSYIDQTFADLGMKNHFVDTGLANIHAGNAHCLTNVIREVTH